MSTVVFDIPKETLLALKVSETEPRNNSNRKPGLPKAICDTSPLQYLHQLELLHVLPALTEGVVVPPAVVDELATGRALRVNLPDVGELDWISVRSPISAAALPLVTDRGQEKRKCSCWL
jgi:hypothetical protein